MAQQPVIKAYYELHIDGKRVGRRRISRSFVAAFTKILFAQVTAANQTIADTSGSNQTIGGNTNNFATNATSGVVTFGIVTGTGTTAVAPSDAKLVTLIANGTSSGQFSYQGQLLQNLTSDSTTNSFQFQRVMINNSGGTITVNEIGIYAKMGASFFGCLVRDVIGGGQAVLAGQSLTVTYTFSAAI